MRHSLWGGFCVEDASGTCRIHVSAEVEDLNDLLDVMSHHAPELSRDPPLEIAQRAWRRPLSYLTGLVIFGLYVASVGRLGTGMSILLGCLVAYLGWTAYREERFAIRSIRVDELTLTIASRSGSTVVNLAELETTEITLAKGFVATPLLTLSGGRQLELPVVRSDWSLSFYAFLLSHSGPRAARGDGGRDLRGASRRALLSLVVASSVAGLGAAVARECSRRKR